MNELPPVLNDPRKTDPEHLKLLTLFHYLLAGLALAGILFLTLHYTLMRTLIFNPKMWESQKGNPPPPELFHVLQWVYWVLGVLLVMGSIANLLSGRWIRARRNRPFSLVVAAINCIQIPLGTALGVFTIIVLTRDSVKELYAAPGR